VRASRGRAERPVSSSEVAGRDAALIGTADVVGPGCVCEEGCGGTEVVLTWLSLMMEGGEWNANWRGKWDAAREENWSSKDVRSLQHQRSVVVAQKLCRFRSVIVGVVR